jgi:hypothetical protein
MDSPVLELILEKDGDSAEQVMGWCSRSDCLARPGRLNEVFTSRE